MRSLFFGLFLSLILSMIPVFTESDAAPASTVQVKRAWCLEGCWRVLSVESTSGDEGIIHVRILWEDGEQVSRIWYAYRRDITTARYSSEEGWYAYRMSQPGWCYDGTEPAAAFGAFAGNDRNRSDHVTGLVLPDCQPVHYWITWKWEVPDLRYVWVPVVTSKP